MDPNVAVQGKSKREELTEKLKKKYPDDNKDYGDDEVFFGAISDDFDKYDKDLQGYKDREKEFSQLLMDNPRSGAFIQDLVNGVSPAVSLVRRYGDKIKDDMNDPQFQEELAKAEKDYLDRISKSKELDAVYEKNIEETIAYLDKMEQEGAIAGKDIDDAMELLFKVVDDGIKGKFSSETIDMAIKAINHDKNVEEAYSDGEIKGRNEKIDEKLRKRGKGDGLPQLGGKNNKYGGGKPKTIFDIAAGA